MCAKCKTEPVANDHTPYCVQCKRDYDREYYRANRKKVAARRAITRPVRHEQSVRYVTGYLKLHPCIDCGESDPLVLEFDHRGEKSKNVSDFIHCNASLLRIQEEIDKCDVRCANCHRRKTAQDFGWKRVLLND